MTAASMSALLEGLTWPFPTWRVSARPFDWSIDEADVPVSPPTWPVSDRRQFDFYLRPAPPAVKRRA